MAEAKYLILVENQGLIDELKSTFNVDPIYILDAKNVSSFQVKKDANTRTIKYKNGLVAVTKQNGNTLTIIQFPSKTKSRNYPRTESVKSERSYIPMKTKQHANRVQGYIQVARTITTERMPNWIKEKHIIDVYKYIDKMVCMQSIVIINTIIWILNFNLHNENDESIYFVADKVDPKSNQGFCWRLRDVLYTAKDIYNLMQSMGAEIHLPMTILTSDEHSLKMKNVILIKRILSNINQRKKIFDIKKPWQKVRIFKNEKQRNKKEKKLGIRKHDFLWACLDFDDIDVLPILLFDKNEYYIDGLWKVRIDDELDIGISFTLAPKKTTIIPTGIHVSRSEMMVQVQLVNRAETIGNFFDTSNWKDKYNNMSIGDPNAQMAEYNRKKKECETLRDKNKQYKSANVRFKSELAQYNRTKQECEILRDENEQYKSDIQQYEDVFEKLKCLNDPKVTQILKSIDGCNNNDTQIQNKNLNTLNPNAKPFVFSLKNAAPYWASYGYKKQMVDRMNAVSECGTMD